MKNTKILVGLLLAYSLNSCSLFGDTEPQLPPETQEGKNTFGCLINGKVWIPYFGGTDIYNTQATKANYDPYRQGQFGIKAATEDNSQIIYIGIWGKPTVKNYDFTKADGVTVEELNMGTGVLLMGYSNYKCDYVTSGLTYFKGKTTITKFDLRSRIAAGTFECTLKTANCDTIKITQGRFDMTF